MPSHAKQNSHKNAIVKKAQRAGLEIPKVKIADDLTECEAFDIECALIKAIGRGVHGGPLVNMSDGGEGQSGHRPSEATRKLISASSKRRTWPCEYSPAFVAEAGSGNKREASEATRRKISAAKTGKRYPAETRAKVSKALRDRGPISDETRQKLGAWQRGRKRSDADKQKMRDGWARRKTRLLAERQGDLFE